MRRCSRVPYYHSTTIAGVLIGGDVPQYYYSRPTAVFIGGDVGPQYLYSRYTTVFIGGDVAVTMKRYGGCTVTCDISPHDRRLVSRDG